ncbi:MAG: F0F1 ATP synthase subunit gamma, partial [Dongiaceae bacterium]
ALIGNKGVSYFKRIGGRVLASTTHLGDRPTLEQLLGVIKVMTDAYREGQIDRLFIVSSTFVNTMTQRPQVRQLLPVEPVKDEALMDHWDYIYEPSPAGLLDFVLQRYIESQVYQAVIENAACEQSARMVAMKSATDNAGKIISNLQLVYNKARQAAITKEISEIVGGAAAV